MDARAAHAFRSVPLIAGGVLAIALILWLDRITPNQYSFEIFYILPILAVTLRGDRLTVALTATLAAIGWTIDTMQEEGFVAGSVGWNVATRVVIFIGVAVLVDLYRVRGVRLAAIDRHREDSLALVAHKLRQTAARIGSVTGAIAARRDTDGIVNEARIALDHQARELQRMAEDVLDVNILEAGRFRLDVSAVDLGELVTDVAREVGRGQVRLVLQADPVVVEGDADRLRVMVGHLITNALRYSPAGAPIAVTVSGGAAEARVVVKDSGVGLRPADLTLLFQKYGQPLTAKTTGAQGVGLGLYITRLLAEAHGGRVTAESVGPGQGSTFQLSLPVRQPTGAS
ncbi:MAG TPA: HAMP domain-containing sensor histidine kinase [Candidatus Limnocylindria bacterium]|nr:HAMP domain-containing sensor histidine kinase [Candidatus Limnocylindria bacterium]